MGTRGRALPEPGAQALQRVCVQLRQGRRGPTAGLTASVSTCVSRGLADWPQMQSIWRLCLCLCRPHSCFRSLSSATPTSHKAQRRDRGARPVPESPRPRGCPVPSRPTLVWQSGCVKLWHSTLECHDYIEN